MKLAFVNATKIWGGVKTLTLDFAAELRTRGHDITFFGRSGPYIDKAANMGFPAHALNFGPDYNPVAIARFYRFFTTHNIELVMVNVGRCLRTAGIAARLAGIPVVQVIGLPGDMRNCLKVRLNHSFIRPHYLCTCEDSREGMLDILPFINRQGTSVILTAKSPLPAPPTHLHRPLRLITTCRLSREKAHEDLMRALARLRQKGCNFRWDVCGNGPHETALHEYAKTLGIDDITTWHGFTQDVTKHLKEADVFVLPSRSEALPNTLQEAMAEGLACISRAVGDVALVWPEAYPELLVPYESDEEGFITALEHVFMADKATVLDMKRAAWQNCVDMFSITEQGEKMERLFQNLIAGRSSGF